MAATDNSSTPTRMSITSYDTALCVIPPRSQCGYIDQLRELYDKAYGRWPPHINLVYPFVSPEHLPQAQQQIQDYLAGHRDSADPIDAALVQAGCFTQKNKYTVFLSEDGSNPPSPLESLRTMVLQALGQGPARSTLHLSIGQSQDNTMFSRSYLLEKARLLPELKFRVGTLAILVRERTTGSDATDHMHLYGTIDLGSSSDTCISPTSDYWVEPIHSDLKPTDSTEDNIDQSTRQDSVAYDRGVQAGSAYCFDDNEYKWSIYTDGDDSEYDVESLTVSSYNVLIDTEYPPTHDRDPSLVRTILSDSAMADILVLQEVSDDFLTYLLGDSEVQRRYPFASHGPPHQPDIGPLPSLRNIVILSRYAFSWKSVPFHRKHKGDKSITEETVDALSSIEAAISDAGLLDAWSVARIEAVDQTAPSDGEVLYEGEEGATFDPQNNRLAAGTTTTSHDRPQRYDRILVRSQDVLSVARFNHFGLPEVVDGAQIFASDHYGVRTKLKITDGTVISSATGVEYMEKTIVEHKRVGTTLSESSSITSALAAHGMFPTDEQTRQHQDAFETFRQILLGTLDATEDSIQPEIPFVMVPVGSYALGVWTSDSDIDCLCIGTISSKTFFKLARQRIIKSDNRGVRILRKVEASTGTMLELSVNGVLMDLQYCPATQVVERWSEFRNIPASDPIFNLSLLSLRKLKPYRDLLYIQRTLPSLSSFRLAYRCIKLWAVQRGLYSAKFGFLGGVHITLMLSWICKRLAYDSGSASAADLVTSFFHHYGQFDWTNEMVYDVFFHKKRPRYNRSAREPMVVLGFHAPNSNIAHTSTVPGLQTLVKEFKAAGERLCEQGMTWDAFFGLGPTLSSVSSPSLGAAGFLETYHNFVKVDIQFWGRTLTKGKSLVGWVESRCISLIVEIHKTLPNSEVRIWPGRFTNNETSAADESRDYHGCYLIGLSKATNFTSVDAPDDKQAAKQALEKVIDRFLTQLRTDEKNYDSSNCWIDASLVRSRNVKELRLDSREWGEYAMEMESDSDDEEDLDEDEEDNEATKPQRAIPQRPKPTSTPLSKTKLRPASDVLNRLRWDPSLDPSDYIIGYEDRFLGAKETGLEKWKTEQTDEEFIPQHRILYFKKKGDDGNGEVVWERATRIDKIFGSGLGAGELKSR
ncbi:Poly(A) polymerase type 3 [Pyrenophora tritici-repentis Pt-1C-BFP]|uniref:polynucleotide adenylyltransferase n=1 Tax=Pyrenophora tritici-repentis (strain Pt-1C-BFP) TaxID=426418 RepID=B2VXV0_PYRTR|nr:Poly(A) polymerase type 3 [Pyrenophora tritici-repentis Pt-1C-BFP]EDU45869.1 Poly(A) polymerase type 3 [Pyrenophora tritici-repentis Pt-1C-BFP]